jgi:hypothetical protein
VTDAIEGNRLVWVGTASTVPSIDITLDLLTHLTVSVGSGAPDLLSFGLNSRKELSQFSANVGRSHATPGLG